MWRRNDGHTTELVGRRFVQVRPDERVPADFTVVDGLDGVLMIQHDLETTLIRVKDVFAALHDGALSEPGVKKRSLFS
jgi:hypothetical protein